MSQRPLCPYCGEHHWVTEMGAFIACYRAHRRDYYHNVLKTRRPLPPVPDGQKRCTRCQRAQPLDSFYRSRSKADGRESWCKSCVYFHKRRKLDRRTRAYREMRQRRNAYMRAWRARNRDHANAYQVAYRRRRRLEKVLERQRLAQGIDRARAVQQRRSTPPTG